MDPAYPASLRTCYCEHCRAWKTHTVVRRDGEKMRWCGDCAHVTVCRGDETEVCRLCAGETSREAAC